ncbi:stage II sporulation protein M [Cellulomonas sp. ATA003]|uniref:stage II sporulation protein M n=1 Tax=Cellulomonas sp. ATA003 TaxID=3073064 RepID=UPI0028737089|nr:stage II sporulation protein M [Cellulomonas sp. ATA003]WNB85737.1 stage II sporulation protein M [Cellulomonas sp. ATA003]
MSSDVAAPRAGSLTRTGDAPVRRRMGAGRTVSACLRRQWPALVLAALLWSAMVAVGYGEGLRGTDVVEREAVTVSGALWWEIFSNNAHITLGLFSGLVCLGITTVLLTATSATILGVLTAQAIGLVGPAQFALGVGPHLVPEMAGFVLATAAGLTSVVAVARRIGGWSTRLAVGQVLRDALVLQLLALVALAIGATIETWVSA